MPLTLTKQSNTQPDTIRLAANGDKAAFRTLMQQHLNLVYNYCYRMCNQADVAEDMTQETFIKVYQNLHRFDVNRPLKPWILTIAANTVKSHFRKNHHNVASLDALQEEGDWVADNNVESQPHHQDDAGSFGDISADDVQTALNELDPKYRQALILRYTNDLSYEDVAQTLDIPLNTTRTWIRRGKEKLKLLLDAIQPNHSQEKP